MALGPKKPRSNRIGLKKMAHTMSRLGVKASDVAMAMAPVVAMAGPEALPLAASLEAGGEVGKKVFGLSRKFV
tara:strand:- start:99 stop:317 length:219 start_codon:yes stop_codon:yes gene_type:complete